jgi:NAD(P)H-dependent FMN reductase
MLPAQIIIASTRPGRVGLPVADCLSRKPSRHGKFGIETIDLAKVALPMFDEPRHPRFAPMSTSTPRPEPHNRARRRLRVRDAGVQLGTPPSLVNALDYLQHEWWQYKPVGFVSYGGVPGGRSVQMTKQIVTALKMMPSVRVGDRPLLHAADRCERGVARAAQGSGGRRRRDARTSSSSGPWRWRLCADRRLLLG